MRIEILETDSSIVKWIDAVVLFGEDSLHFDNITINTFKIENNDTLWENYSLRCFDSLPELKRTTFNYLPIDYEFRFRSLEKMKLDKFQCLVIALLKNGERETKIYRKFEVSSEEKCSFRPMLH